MANSAKRKGDKAELEVQGILRDLLGVPARRALGAGRKDDVGDITGVPDTVIQVVNWKDVAKAVREKPLECEGQRNRPFMGNGRFPPERERPRCEHCGAAAGWHHHPNCVDAPPAFTFAATFVRLRGGEYRVVMTPEQFATLWREAAA